MNTDPDKCDPDVFAFGTTLAMVAGKKAEVDQAADEVRKQFKGWTVDWHYVAGRGVIKGISPNLRKRLDAMKQLDEIKKVAANVIEAIDGWNKDVEKVIGRVPNVHWGDLEKLRELVKS